MPVKKKAPHLGQIVIFHDADGTDKPAIVTAIGDGLPRLYVFDGCVSISEYVAEGKDMGQWSKVEG